MSAEWFAKCVETAAANPEFVARWARLRGVNLPSTPMDWLVDNATGNTDAIVSLFIEGVKELIYLRVPEPRRVA